MHVVYGGYRHEAYEASLRIVPEIQHSELGHRLSARLQFQIDGRLTAPSQSSLLAKIQRLQAAYSEDGGDISLQYAAPLYGTALYYRSSSSLTGIVIKRPPTLIESAGAEMACQFTYSIILEANYVNDNLAPTFVVGFNAGLRVRGRGGALFELVPAKRGLWLKQQTTEKSPVTLYQFGELTGLKQYPRTSVPMPLFPDDLVQDSYEYEEVRAAAQQQTQFTIRYGYEFRRNTNFF